MKANMFKIKIPLILYLALKYRDEYFWEGDRGKKNVKWLETVMSKLKVSPTK